MLGCPIVFYVTGKRVLLTGVSIGATEVEVHVRTIEWRFTTIWTHHLTAGVAATSMPGLNFHYLNPANQLWLHNTILVTTPAPSGYIDRTSANRH